MLIWPFRSPISRFSRFPGGTAKSCSSIERLTWSSLRRAIDQILFGQHFRAKGESIPLKISSDPWSRKVCITYHIIEYTQVWPQASIEPHNIELSCAAVSALPQWLLQSTSFIFHTQVKVSTSTTCYAHHAFLARSDRTGFTLAL